MNSKRFQNIKIFNIIVIISLLCVILPYQTTATSTPMLETNKFGLAIFGGFGYTIIIDNTKNDEDLIVNYTAFGVGFYIKDTVRDDQDNITIPSGGLLFKTIHPVFCFHPFVNITVSLSANDKILVRNGIQLFSKFHIFLTGDMYI